MPFWADTDLELQCFPPVPEHVSMPWDSADTYLLSSAENSASTLILNDRHGALSCALPDAHSWTESYCGQQALISNRARNQLPPVTPSAWSDIEALTDIRQVLIRIPKNNDQLTHQLATIAERWPEATVYLSGMAKHIPVALLNWLEAHSEDYIQHPITRKARLMTLRGLSRFIGLVDIWQGYQYQGMSVEALPGVFGRQQLDPGAAVLLDHLPADAEGTICDLGCGNGILSLALSHQIPGARIIATDDSELAVLSARRNATANALKNIEVRQGNALSGVTETLDWILCNPPFHDGHKELTNIAQLMFRDAARQLSPTGTLLVIANRHLPYQPMLKRLFRSVRVISGDKRFSLYRCQK